MAKAGRIRVGIGGWTYEPWRKTFYPPDLPHKRELEYASRQVTVIEINGTYYRTQSPESFAKWRDETPEDFLFSVKASRYATNRKVLSEAGESIQRFVESGIVELGGKLGPVLWQFAPTKRYEPEDFEGFLKCLPAKARGLTLRHALDVRHESFKDPDFIALARRYGAATVFTDSDDYPSIADVTAEFVYARLMRAEPSIETGYPPAQLKHWAARARLWAEGGEPDDLPRVEDTAEKAKTKAKAAHGTPRDVFILMINGAKERAPAAARALLAELDKVAKPR
jgi:uncharacterized protein YecE (DUF72 family)